MRTSIALWLLAFVAGASALCKCDTAKWAICDGDPCQCTLTVDSGRKQIVNCSTLIPKCFLMKAEMYRARNNQSTRSGIGGKPVETAFVDNDGIYDPECELSGQFKAVQCNNTETCWCVNSAGVRRSDKGDKNIKCEPVETYWVRLELKHKDTATTLDANKLEAAVQTVLSERYGIPAGFVKNVTYDKDARLIVVDVKKDAVKERAVDLSRMAYYMEKDVKVLPMFQSQDSVQLAVDPNNNVGLENILVYYVDEKPPTFTMKSLTGGVIAVIVVVVLAVVIGLLVLFFLRRRERGQFQKTQQREMEPMS